MRILLVEDNHDLATWLCKALRRNNFAIDWVGDGEDADHALSVSDYALVILDLGLPKRGGLDVLRRLRRRGNSCPVIILTANDSLDGRVAGLDEGADDYLAKPFELAELEARIRVQLRRASNRAAPVAVCGDLLLDPRKREFRSAGQALVLTPREYAVLEYLILKTGEAVGKMQIFDAVFGMEEDAQPSAIEIYIHRLRRKLEGGRARIHTLRGLGYVLRADDA
ncbi:response regulator [Azospirillum picis]|uniref:Two-component system response regulator TctD n=1 Tax=Azospirillum picis TaxID=488438 RepID=A0ABU0MR83_9PROT|nr:response regulator [Azospirillum picis]MBP2302011.1 two-component system response regulator TctD [Azospirillum picis]MDQ0535698.1 two-component system response regulator TctD [Azospirillum picis]